MVTDLDKLQFLTERGLIAGTPGWINNCADCTYDYHFGGDTWAYGQARCPNPECPTNTP